MACLFSGFLVVWDVGVCCGFGWRCRCCCGVVSEHDEEEEACDCKYAVASYRRGMSFAHACYLVYENGT